MEDIIQLPDLPLYRYRFALRMNEDAQLPPHLGNMLRGGFGSAFKHTVCMQKHLDRCGDCALLHTCAYPTVFEPVPPPDAEVLRTHERIPSPFVFEPPPGRKTAWEAGDELRFGLHLFGKGVHYLPYFALAFQRLGRRGLHRRHGSATLASIAALAQQSSDAAHSVAESCIWTDDQLSSDWMSHGRWLELPESASGHDVQTATMTFHTPARLKHNSRYVRGAPPFHVLLRTLLRRVSSLSYFHGGQQWETDYRGWIERAEAVDILDARTRWVQYGRYSTRKKKYIPSGGIVGRVTYGGELAPFLPLLRLGEVIHVGKDTVFGSGRYALEV